MEDLIGLAALVLLGLFVGPWVWLALTRSRLNEMQRALDKTDLHLTSLARQLAELQRLSRVETTAKPDWQKAPTADIPKAVIDAAIAAASPLAAASLSATPPEPTVPAPPAATVEPAAPPPASMPDRPLLPSEPPQPQVPPKAPLEERVAFWFTRVGAAAFLLGIAYFFKYAVDNEWIGPWGRIAIGAFAGLTALAAAEVLWRRAQVTYTRVVEGVGLVVLTGSAFAAFALYHLVPPPVAFAAVAVTSLLGGALAAHHRSEPILWLALLGALLAPVFLSTGQDNPAGLFGYLLLVGGLAEWTALREGFLFTPALAIAGSVLLFLGWHFRFFDPDFGGTVAAHYRPLRARLIPEAAVAAFGAEWLSVAWAARRRGLSAMRPLWIALAALVFLHAGFAALLFDAPLSLGAVFVGLAAISTYIQKEAGRPELLALPLGVSFAILALVGRGFSDSASLPMLALLGVWSSVYAAAFVRGHLSASSGGSGIPRALPPTAALLAAGCFGALGLLGSLLLFGPHPLALGLLFAALSVPVLALAALAALPMLAAAAAVTSLAGLFAVSNQLRLVAGGGEAQTDWRLLACAGAWAAVYLASGAWELVHRRLPATPLRLAVVSGAGLGFVGLVLQQTTDAQSLARAALLGAVGAVDLLLGVLLLRRQPRREPASLLLAQALGLFFAAVALLLSGASITIVWAIMAAICAAIAARARDRQWAAGAMALFGVTLMRILTIDWEVPSHAHLMFLATEGRTGQLAPRLLLNPRAYALTACAVALGLAAWRFAAAAEPSFRRAAAALVTVAHAVAVALVLSEAKWAYLKLPVAPQPPLEPDAWETFMTAVTSSVHAQANGLAVLMTILLGIYSLALLGAGFGLRSTLHRYLGLTLFTVTVAKLALWDVWELPRLYQISTLVGVGVLLLVASYLYANRRTALAGLLKGGGTAAALALLTVAGLARAQISHDDFASAASVEGISGPGLYRVEVGPEVWRASKRDLADIRLVDGDGSELPFFVRDPPEKQRPPEPRPVKMSDPVKLADGSFQATFDVADGSNESLEHEGVVLTLQGSDFLRSVRVESSVDGRAFGTLVEGGLVYRVSDPAEGAGRESTAVRYPLSRARFLRVTLLPRGDGREVSIAGASVLSASAGPVDRAPERWLPAAITATAEEAGRHVTDYDLQVGEPGVPLTALRLSIDPGATFERRATVLALAGGRAWSSVGGGMIFRADDHRGHATEDTELSLRTSAGRLRVTVENGDDAQLKVAGAEVRMVVKELVFRAERPGPVELLVGAAAAELPRYDLAAVVERTPNASMTGASLGPLHANAAFHLTETPVASRPWTDRHKPLLALVMGLVLTGLAGWTALLLRKTGDAPQP